MRFAKPILNSLAKARAAPMEANFDPFGGGWHIPERQAEDYMVRYWDIGHDIVAYNPKYL